MPPKDTPKIIPNKGKNNPPNKGKNVKNDKNIKKVVRPSAYKPPARAVKAFAARQSADPKLASIFNNPSAANSEIHVTLTDFFESSSGLELYQQHLADLASLAKLINVSTSGTSRPLARITKYELFALPRFNNGDVAGAALMVLFGLPVTPSVAATGIAAGSTVATRSTLLTPTSVSDWVLVGRWTDHSLSSAPSMLMSNSNGYTALGAFVVVDPDDFLPVATTIQYMARITFAQTIPNDYLYDGEVVNGTSTLFETPSSNTPGVVLSAMLEAHNISNLD